MAKKTASVRSRRRPVPESAHWSECRTAVITGASSGIGREFALLLAQHGYDLVLVARDLERLASLARGIEELQGRQTLVLPIDLASPAGVGKVYTQCAQRSIVPEILINNAGFALYGPFVESDLADHRSMLQVNVLTPVELTRLFLPAMLERRRGYVLNVASTAGFQPGPKMANYYATKSYVIALSVALAQEVKGSGVSVSVLCPGPTKTEFHSRAGIRHTPVAALAFTSARAVAETGYREMLKHKTIIIPGALNKIGAAGVRLLPLTLAAQIVKRLHQ